MDIESLNARHSHAGYVTFKQGPEGFPIALITTPYATAAISLYGAHVLSYRFMDDSNDLLFLSDAAVFREGSAIRGGIPVCWPWFGPDPEGKGRSDHGFARTRMWNVAYTMPTRERECVIALELSETPETLALWPHPFLLTLKITVGRSLTLELSTYNRGDTPMEITQALHTYFNVGDIHETVLGGLEEKRYIDKCDGGNIWVQQGAIRITEETDRIYTTSEGETLLLEDKKLDRTIRIDSAGSRSTIVWNPWINVCRSKSDLLDNDYTTMLCIETANAAEDRIVLAPQKRHSLKALYSPLRSKD